MIRFLRRLFRKRKLEHLSPCKHTILHFTGSEIVQKSWKVAVEVLAAVFEKESVDDFYDTATDYLD